MHRRMFQTLASNGHFDGLVIVIKYTRFPARVRVNVLCLQNLARLGSLLNLPKYSYKK